MSNSQVEHFFEEVFLDQKGHYITSKPTVLVTSFDGESLKTFEYTRECYYCGERPKFILSKTLVTVDSVCQSVDGVQTVIRLNVPSGKILVSDSLNPQYVVDDETFASYNTRFGQSQVVEAMADIGCAYGPVGNTSPSLYKTSEDTYVIANPAYNGDDVEEEENYPGGEFLANVCTDLWAYSIADFEDWKSKGGDPEKLGWTQTVVDVPPGVYEFTHHTGERNFNPDKLGSPVVFADIKYLG